MTETGYLVWLIAMAVMTMSVLTIGTLGAAELLPHQRRAEAQRTREAISLARGVVMTEQLELMLLVAFVVSVTGLLITGMVQLALRLAAPPSERDSRRARGGKASGERHGHTPRASGARGHERPRHINTRG